MCVCINVGHLNSILPYRFVVIVVNVVGVRNEEETVSPFLVLLQKLEQSSREDGPILQRGLSGTDRGISTHPNDDWHERTSPLCG